MLVIKRNGKKEGFDVDKIASAILRAFAAAKEPISFGECVAIGYSLPIFGREEIHIEVIQDEIENLLIENNYKEVVKEFIKYRYRHAEERNIEDKKMFVKEYSKAKNAASGSKFDANANVENKNIATLSGELNKRENILLNRKLMYNMIEKLWGKALADEYLRQLNAHELYKHDETSIKPYCVSINMYPFLLEGLKPLGGYSSAPTHLAAFNGSFINLVFAVAAQFAGAVATPEYLMYMDYFVRKEYGDEYYKNVDKVVSLSNRERTIEKVIEDSFQQVVYSMNQPAAARDYQSVFWNIGYFDKYYFESMFGNFWFPDNTQPIWESLSWLQKKFMKWFNAERTKTTITFPVETMAALVDENGWRDEDYFDFTAEMYSEGHSFFTYNSKSADSLSSCCRLRNEITDNEFSFSLGAGGVATGSKSVMTINVNRLVQNTVRVGGDISEAIRHQVKKVHKYQIAYNEIMKEHEKNGLLPVFDAGFISLNKQFLTIGINGLVEAAEFMGIEISPNEQYEEFINTILKPIYEENKEARTYELMFNTEFVPAENLGVKHANWDRQDGYYVPREVYNSYFYVVEDGNTNIIDKFKLHGDSSVQYLDGGSALHMNLEEHLTKEQYKQVLTIAAKEGTNYFTFNIPNTVCNECGYISKHKLDTCPKCESNDLDYLTRVIGYLKRVSSFSAPRQEEESIRHYAKDE